MRDALNTLLREGVTAAAAAPTGLGRDTPHSIGTLSAPATPESPRTPDDPDVRWTVRRAWPADLDDSAAGLALELEEPASGQRRGAWLTKEGLTVLDGDDRLPCLRGHLRAGTQVVGWRPGKRAVLRTDEGRFVKLARPRATRRALEVMASVDHLLTGVPGAPHLPQAVGGSAPHGVLELAAVNGRPLDVTLPQDPEGEADATSVLLLALSRVGRPAEGDAAPALPVHDPAHEARVLERWAAAALALAPLTAREESALREDVPRVARRLRAPGATSLGAASPGVMGPERVLAHRDLHEGQILRGPDGATTVLDWDTAAWAHPAADLANVLAHLARLARLGALPVPAVQAYRRRLLDRLAEGGHPAASTASTPSLDLLEEATDLRLTAVHAFRRPL